jgi:hypothetical protein
LAVESAAAAPMWVSRVVGAMPSGGAGNRRTRMDTLRLRRRGRRALRGVGLLATTELKRTKRGNHLVVKIECVVDKSCQLGQR